MLWQSLRRSIGRRKKCRVHRLNITKIKIAKAPARKTDEERRQEALDLIVGTVEALVAERGGDERVEPARHVAHREQRGREELAAALQFLFIHRT